MPGSQEDPCPVLVKMPLHGQKMVLSSNWCSSEACSCEFVCMLRIIYMPLFDPWVYVFIDLFPAALQQKWAGMKSSRSMLLFRVKVCVWCILYLINQINNKYYFPTASLLFYAEVPTAIVSCVSPQDSYIFFNVCYIQIETQSHNLLSAIWNTRPNYHTFWADSEKWVWGSKLCRHIFGLTALC